MRGFVPDLYLTLAACDVAVVQGGLTTCMELTAARRPFLYVPLENHFEQNFHVRHRLDRYGAGRCIRYSEASDPATLAEAIARELVAAKCATGPSRPTGPRVPPRLLAELI